MTEPTGNASNRRYRVILTNKSPYPYANQNEYIVSKIDVLRHNTLSYMSNIPVVLWLNWTGQWIAYNSTSTGRFGSVITKTSTNYMNITAINNCLGIAVATIDGVTYASNPIRYNFYQGLDHICYDIDARYGSINRSGFDIFDGYGRDNQFDRMI